MTYIVISWSNMLPYLSKKVKVRLIFRIGGSLREEKHDKWLSVHMQFLSLLMMWIFQANAWNIESLCFILLGRCYYKKASSWGKFIKGRCSGNTVNYCRYGMHLYFVFTWLFYLHSWQESKVICYVYLQQKGMILIVISHFISSGLLCFIS